jgi:hypothetical protein
LADFRAFVSAISRRYEPWVRSWEIWNEPDNPAYWSGTAEEFAALVRAGSASVRESVPGATVVLGGIAWDTGYVERLLRDQALATEIDAVNAHVYFETWSSEPLESMTAYTGRLADLTARFGEGEPVWFAEVGYSSMRRNGRVSDQYQAAYAFEHTDRFQGVQLLRTLCLAATDPRVPLVAWYRVNDLPSAEEVIGDANNRHLGVASLGGALKPAAAAMREAAALFGAPFRCLDREVRIERTLASSAEVHAFERPDGEVFIVAWLRTVVHGERAWSAGAWTDQRVEHIGLRIPRGLGPGVIANEAGIALGPLPIAAGGGGETLLSLDVPGGEIVIARLPALRGAERPAATGR